MKDSFFTIDKPSRGLYKDKGSKFISLAFPVVSENEINSIYLSLQKEYHDARHHCYAWRLGPTGEKSRFNDNGEPSGTAGKPILGQIKSKELTNILIVVVRYFGGILLGTGGLIKAYRNAAADALQNAGIIEQYILDEFQLSFGYQHMNQVFRIIDECMGEVAAKDFKETCNMTVKIRKNHTGKFLGSLNFPGIKIEIN